MARATWFLPSTLPQKKPKSFYLIAVPPTPKAMRKQFVPPEMAGFSLEEAAAGATLY